MSSFEILAEVLLQILPMYVSTVEIEIINYFVVSDVTI